MLEKKQLKRRKISQSLSAEEGTDGNKPSNKRKKQEISFKKKLAKLAVDDPDLYKFLKEEETDLFNLSSGDEEQKEKRIDGPSGSLFIKHYFQVSTGSQFQMFHNPNYQLIRKTQHRKMIMISRVNLKQVRIQQRAV
jgi:hypothetical protein